MQFLKSKISKTYRYILFVENVIFHVSRNAANTFWCTTRNVVLAPAPSEMSRNCGKKLLD